MEFIISEKVTQQIEGYPPEASQRLFQLRELIKKTANRAEGVQKLQETTKWGEPSYVTPTGSTVRMDWKERTPDKYYLYFICTTELVSTFRLIFGDELTFEGNRAIVMELKEPLPEAPLEQCLHLALTYHKIKHLPMLGV